MPQVLIAPAGTPTGQQDDTSVRMLGPLIFSDLIDSCSSDGEGSADGSADDSLRAAAAEQCGPNCKELLGLSADLVDALAMVTVERSSTGSRSGGVHMFT